MGSFFCLHYQFNLFFRFPLLRVFLLLLYRGMRRSERIVKQRRNIRVDSILDQQGVHGNLKVGINNHSIHGKVLALFKTTGI